MSSSDIHNESDEEDSRDSQSRRRGPRPSTPSYLPESPASNDDEDHTDITYDLGARVRAQHPPIQPSASVFDSAYSAGKLVAEPPPSRLTAEAKEIVNDEIDRRDRERDMRDNAAAQLEIMTELAKSWLKEFPHECIPQDNYQLFPNVRRISRWMAHRWTRMWIGRICMKPSMRGITTSTEQCTLSLQMSCRLMSGKIITITRNYK
jgi:hypothetical protein